VSLYRNFFEGKGWSPERLNALTPKQLAGIAGPARKAGDRGDGRRFGSIAEAVAAHKAEKGG
jgi:hypothetical protein